MIFRGEKDWYKYCIVKEKDVVLCRVSVTKPREFLREDKRTISQSEVFDLCQSKLSKSESLGYCKKVGRVNNFSNDLEDVWIFELIVEKPKLKRQKIEKN